MLKIKSLKKNFGSKKVLKGIDLEVNKGDIVGIIGPSGCGKSTLLRTINLLEIPTSGIINFEGKNLVASGVQMEAYSVEDNGTGIKFNIYIYNVQKGIDINYATGESKLGGK